MAIWPLLSIQGARLTFDVVLRRLGEACSAPGSRKTRTPVHGPRRNAPRLETFLRRERVPPKIARRASALLMGRSRSASEASIRSRDEREIVMGECGSFVPSMFCYLGRTRGEARDAPVGTFF